MRVASPPAPYSVRRRGLGCCAPPTHLLSRRPYPLLARLLGRHSWGRAQEVYSEDPRLTSALTTAFVTGIQDTNSTAYPGAAACCKHYLAYNLESMPTGRFYFDANVTGRDLWETYLPAFRACVRDAGGLHVMCSYNAVNGVPACANNRTLNGILRHLWGFEGFVVSDYDAWCVCQSHTRGELQRALAVSRKLWLGGARRTMYDGALAPHYWGPGAGPHGCWPQEGDWSSTRARRGSLPFPLLARAQELMRTHPDRGPLPPYMGMSEGVT